MLFANRSNNRLKSRQKVEESSKSPKSLQRSENFAKAIGLEERLPKHRSSVNWIQRTRASIRALTVFQALVARPRSSLDTTFGSINNQALPTNCKHKVLVRTNYTSNSSEIQKARALLRGVRLNPSAPNFDLRNARPPSGISILEMRSGRRRSSPGSGRKCLMG